METACNSAKDAFNCSLSNHCIVSACPGSGKTHFLVSRAARAFEEIPDSYSYCVSFTNEASNEMKARLNIHCPQHDSRIKCSTFHKFCLESLNAMSVVRLKIVRNDAVLCGILGEVISNTRESVYREIDLLIKEISGVEPDLVVDAESSTDDDSLAVKCTNNVRDLFYLKRILYLFRTVGSCPDVSEVLRSVFVSFSAKLDELHLVDFQLIVATFANRVGTLNVLPVHITHMFVDEFQDLDSEQISLVLVLVQKFNVLLTAVGDPNQSIYSWRTPPVLVPLKKSRPESTSTDNLTHITKILPGSISTFRLRENYRSEAVIVRACNRLIDDNPAHASVPTIGTPAGQCLPTFHPRVHSKWTRLLN